MRSKSDAKADAPKFTPEDREKACELAKPYPNQHFNLCQCEECMAFESYIDGIAHGLAVSRMEIAHLQHVIDRDRYIVAAGTSCINQAIGARMWLFEGRGPYEWDDEDFRKEFADALEAIEQAMEPLKRVAWDKSDCANFEDRVNAAKLAAYEELKRPLGKRDMIAADIGMADPRDAEISRLRLELKQDRQWPDIGIDPMKGPSEKHRGEPAIARLRQAYVIQQPIVPNQMALVWRADLGFANMELVRLYAWQKEQKEEISPAPALQKALEFCCMALAFIGRDQGTDRLEKTLDGLCKEAAETEKMLRAAIGGEEKEEQS